MNSRKTIAAVLLACAAILAGQAGPGVPVDLADAKAVAQLQADLASDDFAVRQRGQVALDHIYADRREALRKVAEQATDPEAKARMMARVDALDELVLTDPPGISIDLKNAPLSDFAAALSEAQGTPILPDSKRGIADERFTLKADNLPFWEIERQLSAQLPVWFDSTADGIRLVRDAGWRESVRVRGFEVCVAQPRLPDPQGVGGKNIVLPVGSPAKYICVLGLGLDPRIPVAGIGLPKVDVTDGFGGTWKYSVLAPAPGPKAAKVITFNRTLALVPPEKPGEALNIKGTWPVMLLLSEEKAVVKRFDAVPEEALRVGNAEITIDRLILMNPAAGIYTLQISAEVTLAAGASTPTAAMPAAPITMSVLDAAGNVIASRAVATDTLKTSATIALKAEPLRLVFSRPGKTREFQVPFEFKDLAIKP